MFWTKSGIRNSVCFFLLSRAPPFTWHSAAINQAERFRLMQLRAASQRPWQPHWSSLPSLLTSMLHLLSLRLPNLLGGMRTNRD